MVASFLTILFISAQKGIGSNQCAAWPDTIMSTELSAMKGMVSAGATSNLTFGNASFELDDLACSIMPLDGSVPII